MLLNHNQLSHYQLINIFKKYLELLITNDCKFTKLQEFAIRFIE